MLWLLGEGGRLKRTDKRGAMCVDVDMAGGVAGGEWQQAQGRGSNRVGWGWRVVGVLQVGSAGIVGGRVGV